MSPTLRRSLLAFAALGVAFLGALLVLRGAEVGWALIAVALPASLGLALAGDALGGDFAVTLRTRWVAFARQMRPWTWLLALYVALKIPVPLWPDGFPVLGLASTAALFLSALAFAWERVGARKALLMAALAFGAGLGVEMLGNRTGFPFGIYSYATAPGPRVFEVPLLVPLGWFAFSLAGMLLSGGRAWLAGLLMMLWDVGLEPLLTAERYWLWSDPNPLWAGAPLQNFLGWWAVGSLIGWAFGRIAPELFRAATEKGRVSFSLAYPIETFFLPGGLILVGRPLEAGVTLIAMLGGNFLARAVRRA